MPSLLLLALPLVLCPGPRQALSPDLVNPGFEVWEGDHELEGWTLLPASAEAGWTVERDEDEAFEGETCARIGSEARESVPVGALLLQDVDARAWRGKRVRWSASLQVDNALARMWVRVDRPDGAMGFHDDMRDRPVEEGAWRTATIVGTVAEDALSFQVGFEVQPIGEPRRGEVWIDAVEILEVAEGEAVGPVWPAPLGEQGLANLRAFAALLGAVRFFHPSDEAAAADWERFAAEGVLACEQAVDAPALAETLRALYAPVAPTLLVAESEQDPSTSPLLPRPSVERWLYQQRWTHRGCGLGGSPGPYRSTRERRRAREDEPAEWMEAETAVVELELGQELRAVLPTALWADRAGTLPRATAAAPPSRLPEDYQPLGADRTTRLAAVCLAWSTLAHFYPYFDVVDVDWDAALDEALARAATDAGASDFHETLEILVARLEDGHGAVSPSAYSVRWSAPVALAWIDAELCVAADSELYPLAAGDRIVAIGGVPTGKVYAELARRISGASEGWIRYRARSRLLRAPLGSALVLEVEPFSEPGTKRELVLEPPSGLPSLAEPRPEVVCELEPGVHYVDLTRCDNATFLDALEQLADARAIVFDLRGYPGSISPETFLAHLVDEPVTSPQWHVPVQHAPSDELAFELVPGWHIAPAEPRLTEHCAFLIGPECVSYAESCLGIVEHYRLGALVGAPTAGTNGNVSAVELPGGFEIRFTGMRVLKHDGARHHGVGIVPTHPVARTRAGLAAGRDEALEAALEHLRGAGRK